MNKIALPLSIIAIIISVFSFFFFKSYNELVYVDVNKLMEGYNRTKIVKAGFEEKAKTLNSNVDSLMTDWQKELKLYEKERFSMTEKELELKQQILSNKQLQLNNYQQAIQKQIAEEDKKATQTVLNDINDFVKQFGEEKGYRMIFGANGGGNIMYGSEVSDLTNEMIKGLNAQFENR